MTDALIGLGPAAASVFVTVVFLKFLREERTAAGKERAERWRILSDLAASVRALGAQIQHLSKEKK